jgi:hypothetical protein
MKRVRKMMRIVCAHCNQRNDVLPPKGTALFRLPRKVKK